MENIYTNEELEDKTKRIYHLFVNSKDSFKINFEKYFDISCKLTFGDMKEDDCIYELLNNYYRNEYYVKRAFKKKYLKSDNVLFEYPIEDSRADLIDIDSMTCYEIKTKYDNLNRLSKQIKSYSKVFKYVYIICSKDKVSKIENTIPSYCGIISYSDRKNCGFSIFKKATISTNYKIHNALKCCNKAELKKQFKMTNIDDIVMNYSKDYINRSYKEILVNRV